jgi:hypothetical protein
MCLPIHQGLRTVVTVETIWDQIKYLTYIDFPLRNAYPKQQSEVSTFVFV